MVVAVVAAVAETLWLSLARYAGSKRAYRALGEVVGGVELALGRDSGTTLCRNVLLHLATAQDVALRRCEQPPKTSVF